GVTSVIAGLPGGGSAWTAPAAAAGAAARAARITGRSGTRTPGTKSCAPDGPKPGGRGVCDTRRVLVALVRVALAAVAVAAAAAVAMRRARAEAEAARRDAARAAAEADRADRRAREVLQDLPLVAMRVDAAGRIVEANQMALERFPFLVAGI